MEETPLTHKLFKVLRKRLSLSQEIQNILSDYSFIPPGDLRLIILDEYEVLKILRISKRKLAQLRADREIEFHPTGGKRYSNKALQNALDSKSRGNRAGRIYYTLQGVIDYIKRYTIKPTVVIFLSLQLLLLIFGNQQQYISVIMQYFLSASNHLNPVLKSVSIKNITSL